MKHIIASTREPVRPVIIRSLIPLATVLLLAAAGLLYNHHQAGEIASLQERLDGLAVVKSQHRDLRLKLTSIEQKMKQQRILLSKLRRDSINAVVGRIGHCMPSDVWLNELVISDMKTLRLSGSSFLETGIFDFTEWLGQAPEFADVALRSTSPGNSRSGPTVDFNVEINLDGSGDSVEEVASNE